MKKAGLVAMLFAIAIASVCAQTTIKGAVFDAATNQPLEGVSIVSAQNGVTTISGKNGIFFIKSPLQINSILVSYIGYQPLQLAVNDSFTNISLKPSFASLYEVVVSGSRELQRRTEVPAAINVISKTLINDTKATRLDMLVNKVPGVFMVDLGNEQHSMSVRQPLGYSNLFLYLEDGIPIRTVGDFNHNALIEVNQASLERIEVIKGPASSLYGSEAVGGALNFITQSPSIFPSAKLQVETGSRGYRRTDFNVSNTYKKFGFFAGGYYANQNQEDNQHNDFNKTALTARADYAFNDRIKLVTVADYINYKTDQKGGLDSTHFYNKDYQSFYRFSYRKVNTFRLRSTLTKEWNDNNKTSFTAFYRHSVIGQNPFYYISDLPANPLKAKGQINEDAFKSYGTVLQHVKKLPAINGKWITGISADFSPATYFAKYIDVDKDNNGVYYNYSVQDSLLTNYNVDLLNTAAYTQLEFNATAKLKVVVAARYDRLDYRFDNHLLPGAFTGAPDAKDHFDHFTPKIGFTYNVAKNIGVYSNYSVGFAPPNITDLYSGVIVPALKPAAYNNYEVGGWMSFAKAKGYAEVSFYKLDGSNEIVNVRLEDGTYQNQNAGITRHKGVEVNVKYAPCKDLSIRAGGTYAQHIYKNYELSGKNYSGNTMSQAPPYIINAEITYKPAFFKGFRLSMEYQGLGKYYTDAQNTSTYNGFHVFNARMGYSVKSIEIWANCTNLTDAVYATTVEKSVYGTTYRPGQLRTLNIGIAYNYNKK